MAGLYYRPREKISLATRDLIYRNIRSDHSATVEGTSKFSKLNV